MTEATATTEAPTQNQSLITWVEEIAELTTPASIHWCDGSAEEYDSLCQELVDAGTFRRLSDAKRPNSYLAWSDPSDVARVEHLTFICTTSPRATPGPPTTGMRPEDPPADRKVWPTSSRGDGRQRCTPCLSRWARSAPTAASSACS